MTLLSLSPAYGIPETLTDGGHLMAGSRRRIMILSQ